MTSKQILKKMGMSDSELRDFLAKLNVLLAQLTPAQRRAAKAGSTSSARAAKAFGPGLTAKQLERFLAERGATSPIVIVIERAVHEEEAAQHKKKNKK